MINQSIQNYNEYFNKIDIQTSHTIPHANAGFQCRWPKPQMHSMFVDMVFKLKNKTGHGHDDMPTRLLKERISIIIHPIT